MSKLVSYGIGPSLTIIWIQVNFGFCHNEFAQYVAIAL